MAYVAMVYGLDRCGLLSEDEPRYASIGREMAQSGDWVTPRLWGEAWFEKPALLYWMIGAATKVGLHDELAARLPVALVSLVFLYYYWRVLAREFGLAAAWYATAMLGTSAGWVAYSHVAVTDLPLSAAFGAAMLTAMPWVAGKDIGWVRLAAAGGLLGVAVLAKGLVPLALALPALWLARGRWRDFAAPALTCLAVASPWYVACWWVNGQPFLDEFFGRHHFQRATSDALRHVQPWWYYGPVILAGMFPWTPLVGLAYWRKIREDGRLGLLAAWAGFGFVLFSAVPNKLPGYLLPLLPAVFGLVGVRLSDGATRARWLSVCALLVSLIPVAGWILPKALADGISTVNLKAAPWSYVGIGFVLLGAVWGVRRRWGTGIAMGVTATAAVAGLVYLKAVTLPVLDEQVSARGVWRRVEGRGGEVCESGLNRTWKYGLNYYARMAIPSCEESPQPVRIRAGETTPVIEGTPR
jgi:4-amino-4-deoxy-L-arabinose transferase-like glycosyltransferase